MADNITIPVTGTGSATPVIAADDISSVFHQRVKIEYGADGSATDVSASAPLPVTQIPSVSGGLSLYHVISAASTNAASVKASAGQLYGWSVSNASTGWRYVKLHNTAGTPTAGSGIVQTIAIPPSGGSNIELSNGVAFGTGIGISIVTGIGDSDATAVGASEVSVDLFYK